MSSDAERHSPVSEVSIAAQENFEYEAQSDGYESNNHAGERERQEDIAREPPEISTNVAHGCSVSANPVGKDLTAPRIPTFQKQLGNMAITTLVLGTFVIMAALSFTAFLWFSDDNNPTWHAIMVRDWLTEATTILSEAIKQALNVQVGVCGAMLAALALERGEVSLGYAALLTTMRNGLGSSKVLSLSKIQFQSRKAARAPILVPLLVILEAMILAFGQVITIVLTSDIGLYPVPGFPQLSQTPFGFTYLLPNHTVGREDLTLTRGTSWSRKAPFFPTFAEYTEPPFTQDGVSDTGITLRAFLPYSSAQTRENTYSYQGRTTVLDARVTCQAPVLANEGVQYTHDQFLGFSAAVRPSRSTPNLANLAINDWDEDWDPETGYPTYCLASAEDNHSGYNQWKTTLCQLGEGGQTHAGFDGWLGSWAGGLISEFSDNGTLAYPKDQLAYGNAYLILNVTRGSAADWATATQVQNDDPNANVSIPPPQYSSRHEWVDLIYDNGELVLSVSLCYTGFTTADLPVKMSSNANRTEPTTSYDFDTSTYNFDAVREQLGQYSDQMSLESRGVLQLDKQNWAANETEIPPVEPYCRDFANFLGPTGTGNQANWSSLLYESQSPNGSPAEVDSEGNTPQHIIPEITHVWLFQQIVNNGGSVAFGLQSLITVLSSIAYYDQIGLFDNKAEVSQTLFITANTPRHCRGFVAVVIMLTIHVVLVVIIMSMFSRGTRYSMLGQDWQALAQGISPETETYLAVASRKTDDGVQRNIEGDGLKHLRVGIGQIEGTDQVGIVSYDSLRKRGKWAIDRKDREEQGYELRDRKGVGKRRSDDSIDGMIDGYREDANSNSHV